MRSAPALLLVVVLMACGREQALPTAATESTPVTEVRASLAGTALVDFEGFTLGAIHGQFDWQSVGGAGSTSTVSKCATYDHVIAGTALPAAFGSRSLRISNAVTSGCYSDQTFSQRAVDIAGQAG